MKKVHSLVCNIFVSLPLFPQSAYMLLPPKEVIDIVDAPPTSIAVKCPAGDALMPVEYRHYPSMELLARSFRRIADLRITPKISASQRILQYTGIIVKWIEQNKTVRISIPQGASIGFPSWSFDGDLSSPSQR